MTSIYQHLVLPSFEPFIIQPNNPDCRPIEPKDLVVEILGGISPATSEIARSQKSTLIEGPHALVFRCRRAHSSRVRAATVLSFDINQHGAVEILQLQGTKDSHVGYRFNSSFDVVGYVVDVMEQTFLKTGTMVSVTPFPTGIEGASYAARSISRYELLRSALLGRAQKYGLQ